MEWGQGGQCLREAVGYRRRFSGHRGRKGKVPSTGLTSTSSSVKSMTVRAFLTTFQSLLSLMEETLAHWPWGDREGGTGLPAVEPCA